ncbi:MAG: hypothetical protein EP318_20305 [Rhodobacteraceae bacterium]|nr:MAG: hypothetical protein EP318_20305 [Paracoccaceae bacterium]
MIEEFAAAGALLAACGLIFFVACMLINLKAWGQTTGFGDLPAGIVLGATATAQLFHPIEPFAGFIFDLRNLPLALAGAFLNWRAALVAVAMAALARAGVGGTGMWTGIVAMAWAAGAAALWKHARARWPMRPLLARLALGGLVATSVGVGVALPDPVRGWFFTYAAPLLVGLYLVLLPALVWLIDRGVLLDSLSRRNTRSALKKRNVDVLTLPAFTREIRLSALLGQSGTAHSVLCLRLWDLERLKGRHAGTDFNLVRDAVMLRLSGALPEIRTLGLMDRATLLLPITREQFVQLDRIRDAIKAALHESPFFLKDGQRHWASYDLGLLPCAAFAEGDRLLPRRISNCPTIDRSQSPRPARVQDPRDHARISERFEGFENADMLFFKAAHLMTPSTA